MKSNITLDHQKLELIQWLSSLEDVSLIEKIAQLRANYNKDWADQISAEEKNALEKGLQDALDGKINAHIKARAAYEKWL